MLSQLHSVFTTHTLIERELSSLVERGVVRKLQLRGSAADGRGGEVTGVGGDFGLILSATYNELLSQHAGVETFAEWLSGPGKTVVTILHSRLVEHVGEADIKRLVEMGFLTMDYSIREAGYLISLHGVGNFIRNLRGGRKELLRALKRQKYREMLEKVHSQHPPPKSIYVVVVCVLSFGFVCGC